MKEKPIVSVVIPAYNAERFIAQCLHSVLGQSLNEIEVIVVDDGSMDATSRVVGGFCSTDERVSLVRQQNQYAGVARNVGMNHARGEYLYFLDADDYIDPDFLGEAVSRMRQDNSDVAICRAWSVDYETNQRESLDYAFRFSENNEECIDPRKIKGKVFQDLVGWPWDKIFKAEFIKGRRLEYQNLRSTNDAYFVFLSVCLAEKISILNRHYVYHRTNNSSSLEKTRSTSWNNATMAALAIERGLKEYGIYELYSQSYLEWLFHFSFWNYSTLSKDARRGMLSFMEEEVAPRLSKEVIQQFTESYERKAAKLLVSNGDVLNDAFEVCIDYQGALEEIGHLDSACRENQARLQELYDEVASLRLELDSRANEVNAIRSSKSYRLGRFLTFLPRKIAKVLRA